MARISFSHARPIQIRLRVPSRIASYFVLTDHLNPNQSCNPRPALRCIRNRGERGGGEGRVSRPDDQPPASFPELNLSWQNPALLGLGQRRGRQEGVSACWERRATVDASVVIGVTGADLSHTGGWDGTRQTLGRCERANGRDRAGDGPWFMGLSVPMDLPLVRPLKVGFVSLCASCVPAVPRLLNSPAADLMVLPWSSGTPTTSCPFLPLHGV